MLFFFSILTFLSVLLAGKSSMQPRQAIKLSNCNVRWLSRISRNFVRKLQAFQRKCLSVLEISECAVCLLAWVCDALDTLVFPINVYACLFFFGHFSFLCYVLIMPLTLIGMREGTFIPLYRRVHISSDEVFSKILKKPSILQK